MGDNLWEPGDLRDKDFSLYVCSVLQAKRRDQLCLLLIIVHVGKSDPKWIFISHTQTFLSGPLCLFIHFRETESDHWAVDGLACRLQDQFWFSSDWRWSFISVSQSHMLPEERAASKKKLKTNLKHQNKTMVLKFLGFNFYFQNYVLGQVFWYMI